jgi:hypothetical protein
VHSSLSLSVSKATPSLGSGVGFIELTPVGAGSAGECPDRALRAAGLRRDAAHGTDSLYARDLAERACGADGLRGKQQPRNGVGHWRVGSFLHRPQDLAAIDRFPMGAGIAIDVGGCEVTQAVTRSTRNRRIADQYSA